jgi:hypothetical protein
VHFVLPAELGNTLIFGTCNSVVSRAAIVPFIC